MNSRYNNLFPILAIAFWLMAGLYFGSGGITRMQNDILLKKFYNDKDTVKVRYDSVNYLNKNHLISRLESGEMSRIYPFLDAIPLYLSYLITAGSFGLLGTLVYLFFEISFNKKRVEELPYISLPILGLLTGILVLGLSLIFPNLLFANDTDLKPGGLMFVCMLCGIYSKRFYSWMSLTFGKLISKSNEEK